MTTSTHKPSPKTILNTAMVLLLCVGAALLAHTAAAWTSAYMVIAVYGALFLPYGVLLARARRCPEALPSPWVIVAGALMARVVMAFADPLLSDDLFRYVWDGRVAFSGINPFAYAPSHEALAHLRDVSVWPNVNHPTLPTIYPPAAQYLFWLNASVDGGITTMRLLFVIVELVAGFGIWRMVRRAGWSGAKQTIALAIYALNPLVMVEVAWSGHVDVLAWSLLVGALVCFTYSRTASMRTHVLTGVLLGLSISAKFLGLMALPVLLFAPRRPHAGVPSIVVRRVALMLTTLLVFAASYGPYLNLGAGVFGSLGKYAASWKTNDSIFRVVDTSAHYAIKKLADPKDRVDPKNPDSDVIVRLNALDKFFMARGWTKTWQGKQIPNTSFMDHQVSATLGKLAALFFMGMMLLWCLIVVRDVRRSVAMLFLTLYLVAPTVMPWYVAWLVPLALFVDGSKSESEEGQTLSPHAVPLLLYSGLVVMSYSAWASARHGGAWRVPDALIALEFGILYVAIWLSSSNADPLETEHAPHHHVE